MQIGSIPWKRYFAEGLIIAVSILLAFSIDAWWQNREDQNELNQLLQLLETEIEENLAELDRSNSYRFAVLEVTESIHQTAEGFKELSATEFDNHLADLFWWRTTTFSVGALSNFLEGGKLALVDDPALALHITDINEKIERVRKVEEREFETTRNELVPLFLEHGSFAQIDTIIGERNRPGFGGYRNFNINIETLSSKDHREILNNEKFKGLVTMKTWDQTDALNEYEDLRESFAALSSYLLTSI